MTSSYSQVKQNVTLNGIGKIYLFGENHFVKEKYDEMKTFIMERLESVPSGEKVTMFLELPTSFNFALNKMKLEKDTIVFNEWFMHLYKQKNVAPSFFWTDYQEFILSILQFAEKKEIDFQFKAIDTELEFRRTAFVLSSFDDTTTTQIDSLLNVNYIEKNETNRSFLINYVNDLAKKTTIPNELKILDRLKEALLIDCTICRKRDEFMYDNFIRFYDTKDYMVFGTFGLDHVVNSQDFSAINDFFKFNHKVDTVNHKSLYNFLKEDFKQNIYRVGIIALNQNARFSNLKKPRDYSYMMNSEEREHIENLLTNEEVIRIYPSEDEVLKNLAKNLDYIIIYNSSNFRY
ncbi:hypothetical protein [uncultured Flavobacterium sp.]|uniref:hypothetical protein n=1 Tax=uncultured Flavobacterium sp. TaxID=165435 RepID=UPI0030C8AA9E